MDLFLSIFPIVLLIYLMVKRNAFPSYVALPLIAGIVYLLQLFYFKNEFILLNANIVSAIISVFTPISVIFGAVFFNRMMESSGAMNTLRSWLGNISENPVAQLMIIGWYSCGHCSTYLSRYWLQTNASGDARFGNELRTGLLWGGRYSYLVWLQDTLRQWYYRRGGCLFDWEIFCPYPFCSGLCYSYTCATIHCFLERNQAKCTLYSY